MKPLKEYSEHQRLSIVFAAIALPFILVMSVADYFFRRDKKSKK